MPLTWDVNYPSGQTFKLQKKVFFTGSTALNKGQALCYVRDTGTATVSDANRDYKVALPSASNNLWFAGVCDQAYSAATGGQQVTINLPGSICEILCGVPATTVASTRVGFGFDTGSAGWFLRTPLIGGRGSALILQTTSALSDTTTTPGVVNASFSGAATVSSATITNSSNNTSVAAAGDTVFVVGGVSNTIGSYTVSSSTSTTIVLSSAPGGSSNIGYCCVRGAPTVLAYLEEGPGQSGGVAHITPLSGGTVPTGTGITAGTLTALGGTYRAVGTITVSTGASSLTLTAGTSPMQRLAFVIDGTLTTNGLGFVVTNLLTAATGAQPTSLNMLLVNSTAMFEWGGTRWSLLGGLNVLV